MYSEKNKIKLRHSSADQSRSGYDLTNRYDHHLTPKVGTQAGAMFNVILNCICVNLFTYQQQRSTSTLTLTF